MNTSPNHAKTVAKYKSGKGIRFATAPYTTYVGIKSRCENPNNPYRKDREEERNKRENK